VKAGAAALCGGRLQAVPDAEPAGLVQKDQGEAARPQGRPRSGGMAARLQA
jgi:hypothetical protein